MISMFQDLADEVDVGYRKDAILIGFAKAFNVVPRDIFLQLGGTCINKTVIFYVQEFLKKLDTESLELESVSSDVTHGPAIIVYNIQY